MFNMLIGIWIGGAIATFFSTDTEYGKMPDKSYLIEVGIVSALWPIYMALAWKDNWKYRND